MNRKRIRKTTNGERWRIDCVQTIILARLRRLLCDNIYGTSQIKRQNRINQNRVDVHVFVCVHACVCSVTSFPDTQCRVLHFSYSFCTCPLCLPYKNTGYMSSGENSSYRQKKKEKRGRSAGWHGMQCNTNE